MNPARWRLGLLAVALLVGGGLWLYAEDRADGTMAGVDGEAAGSPPSSPRASETAAPATPGRISVKRDAQGLPLHWPPLPAVEAPFAGIAVELQRRAAGGDPKAACRLAAEISRCAQVKEQIIAMDSRLRWQRDNPEAAARQRQRGGDGGSFMVERGEQLLAEDARCEGSGDFRPGQKYQWLRQAALAGHLPSMAEYASGNAFRSRDTLESLSALATYRAEAEAMARQAADNGDAAMVLALAQAYSPAQGERYAGLLQQAVQDDTVESLSRYLQVQGLLPTPTDRRSERSRRQLEQQLAMLQELATPAQRSEAAARASRRAAEWKPAIAGDEPGLAILARGRTATLKPEQCDLDIYVR